MCRFSPSAWFVAASCMLLQNFVAIGCTVAELLQVFDFQYGGRPPSWIFKISIFLPSALFAVTICLFVKISL